MHFYFATISLLHSFYYLQFSWFFCLKISSQQPSFYNVVIPLFYNILIIAFFFKMSRNWEQLVFSLSSSRIFIVKVLFNFIIFFKFKNLLFYINFFIHYLPPCCFCFIKKLCTNYDKIRD